ncbi:nucleotide sugar dehydrogenase (plasmid) [Haloferacaceae archaeon DSL9]
MSRSTASISLYDDAVQDDDKRRAFLTGDVPVAVYGLGKMGLPLAGVFADVSGNVVGADVDESVVDAINAGDCHVTGEPELPDLVAQTVEDGALRAVSDPKRAAADAQLHVIIVPTLLTDDNRAELSILESVVRDIATGLSPGDLVVVESTVPPRTCEDRLYPLLCEESGLDPGAFGFAFCPERTKSGRAIRDIRGSWPKVVGGIDDQSGRAAALVYDEITSNDVIRTADATTAEAVKVFEGVHRDLNIALANELACYTDAIGINVREAITVANTQDECDILHPGPGVGGHCIPYYPYFLMNEFDVDSPLVRTAREVNDEMPSFVVECMQDQLDARGKDLEESTVLVLGLTYRAGVAETRASPSIGITHRLDALGADVLLVDPMLESTSEFAGTPVSVDESYERDVDGIILSTAHREFDGYDWSAFDDLAVVDSRGVLDPADVGHDVYAIGGRAVDGGEFRA